MPSNTTNPVTGASPATSSSASSAADQAVATAQAFAKAHGITMSAADIQNIRNSAGGVATAAAADPTVSTLSHAAQPPTASNPLGLSPYDQWASNTNSNIANGASTVPADTRMDDLVTNQFKIASDFQSNIPELSDSLFGQAANNQKSILASQINDTTASYNKRGLLYGAGIEGAKSADTQASAAALNQDKSNINTSLEQTAAGLNDTAVNTATNVDAMKTAQASGETDAANSYLNIALNNQQQQSNALSSIGNAVGSVGGYVAGTLAGSGSGTSPTPTAAANGTAGLLSPTTFNNWPGSSGTGSGLGVASRNT